MWQPLPFYIVHTRCGVVCLRQQSVYYHYFALILGLCAAGEASTTTYSGDYTFEDMTSNPYSELDDAFERGKQLFDEGLCCVLVS